MKKANPFTILLAIALVMVTLISFAGPEDPYQEAVEPDANRLQGLNTFTETITNDSVLIADFRTVFQTDVARTFSADTVTTFYIFGSQDETIMLPLDTVSYTTTALNATLTNVPGYVKIYAVTEGTTVAVRAGTKATKAF